MWKSIISSSTNKKKKRNLIKKTNKKKASKKERKKNEIYKFFQESRSSLMGDCSKWNFRDMVIAETQLLKGETDAVSLSYLMDQF